AQLALDQARADRARMEAERDALRATVQAQVGELAAARTERENMVGELAKLSALLEAQQVMLTDYRAQLGVAGPAA
ncbi:integrase, partial [Mycobacterium tuberculosis]|nr:integrase [Mycobacterium tuberculosis]